MTDYIRWERDHIHHTYADMLARIRSGVRVTWKRGKFYVLSNPHGLGEISWGAYENADQARTKYLLCCSLADLPPSSHLGISGIAGSP